MMYNNIVEDCFFNPEHAGVLDENDPWVVCLRKEQPNNTNRVIFYLQCSMDGVVSKACFKSNGNPYMIAALEWICRQSEGKELNTLLEWNYQALIKTLDIPTAQYPVAVFLNGIYKEALVLMRNKLER